MEYFLFMVFDYLSHNSSVNNVIVEPELEEEEEEESNKGVDDDGQTSRLWVDRFSPRQYTELLSDDVSSVL